MLVQDFLYGLRILRKSPGFTSVAVLTLALGIGANLALFSYVDALWLSPLPVPQPDRVVRIYTSNPGSHGEVEQGFSSYPDFQDLRADSRTFSGVGLMQQRGAMYDDGSQTRLVIAAMVSDNFFDVLQPRAVAGRTFREAEMREFSGLAVVISYSFWQRAFNRDRALPGRTITLDRQRLVVLGVLPRGFRATSAEVVPDVWIPFSTWKQFRAGEQARFANREFRDYDLFGRLAQGVTLPQARAELAGIASRLALAYPRTNNASRFSVLLERETRGSDAASSGVLLLSIAIFVLLIACANVSSLLLARAEHRRRELATRIALGASRTRIATQLLVETSTLAVLGGISALVLARWILQALPSLLPQTSIPVFVDAYLSSRGLVVAIIVASASLFMFGLVPAFSASSLSPVEGIKQASSLVASRAAMRSALVIGQVALSLVLVVSAGLLLKSVWNGMHMNPGFDAQQQMLVADFAPSFKTDAENQHMIEEARRRINALPGVAATAFGMRIPFGLSGGGATHKVFVPELPATAPRGVTINFVPVSDHYFEVLGTRLLHGRSIDRQDVEGGARVMIVNQQFASRFWPNQDPLGRTVRLDRADGSEYQIIGLVEDGKYSDIQEDAKPYFFIPLKSYDYGEVSMVIKTSAASSSLISPVRQALRSVDNDVAILNLVTLREHMGLALYDQRVKSRLIAALGALGLALAAIGLYGLMAFLVSRRTREIGVRLALGSSRAAIFRLTLAQALRLGAIGVAIGSLAAVPATRLLRSMLVAVSPVDPIVFACAIFVLLFAAIVAALAPARNAVRIDPIKALRAE